MLKNLTLVLLVKDFVSLWIDIDREERKNKKEKQFQRGDIFNWFNFLMSC